MKHILLAFGVAYAIAFGTWLFYLAAQSVQPRKRELHPVARLHAYVLVAIGLALDAVLNVVVASVLFLKLPQDVLLTGRLIRYKNDAAERAWRRKLAVWICEHLLDVFDADGCHCQE